MGALIIPSRFNQQPQQAAQIDIGNSYSGRLAFLWSGAVPDRDLVSQQQRTTDNTSPTVTTLGRAITSTISQVNIEWNRQFITTSSGDGLGDFTMAAYANPASTGAGVEHIFAQKNDASGSPFSQCGLLAQSDAGAAFVSGSFAFFTFNGSTASGVAVSGACDGSYHWWVGVRRGAIHELYKDGVLIGSSSLTVVGITQSASRYTAIGSRGNGSTESYTKQVVLVAGWNRALSYGEAKQSPWQLFKAPQRRIWGASTVSGIAFDAASNSGYQAAASTYTFNRTVTGSNTFLAVDVSLLSPGQTVTSVVDDSGGGNVALTFIGAQSTVTSFGRVEQWGLVNPTAGTKTIQVNLSGSIASAATAVSYTGVHQTVPTEAFNSAQATNVGAADATVSVTTIADNCWVHGAIATGDTSVTANQTSRNNVTGVGGSGANEDNNAPKTPAGAVTMSYTNVGAAMTWAIAGYAIRPVAASGGTTKLFMTAILNGLGAGGRFFQNRLG